MHQRHNEVCASSPVFFSKLAKWLTLPGGCQAPVADGDQYEAREKYLWGFCSLGCQSLLSGLISDTQFNVFIII